MGWIWWTVLVGLWGFVWNLLDGFTSVPVSQLHRPKNCFEGKPLQCCLEHAYVLRSWVAPCLLKIEGKKGQSYPKQIKKMKKLHRPSNRCLLEAHKAIQKPSAKHRWYRKQTKTLAGLEPLQTSFNNSSITTRPASVLVGSYRDLWHPF